VKTIEFALTFLYLITCIGIGIWANKKVRSSTDDYWVAGRKIGTFANSWAMMAALASGGSVLGVMGLAYKMGIPYTFSMYAGAAAGFPLAAVLVAKQLRNSGIYTITDFLRLRYKNKAIELIVPIIIILAMGAYIVAQMKAAGITAVYLLGIPYNYAIIITAIVFILYVSIGGMWAITLTDIIQGILMVSMVLVLAVVLYGNFGGITSLLSQAVEASPKVGTIVDLPTISYVGAFVVWFVAACVTPHLVMRVFTSRDVRSAKYSLSYSIVIYAFMIVFGVIAVTSAGHIVLPDLQDPDTLFLKLIEMYLPRIIGGFAVAAVMAAVMSTTDALLLSVSSAIVNDIYCKFINKEATDKQIVKVSLIVTWVIGILAVFFALNPPKLLTMFYTAAVGWLGSALFAPIILGIWWKKATTKGALWSIIIGSISYLYLMWFTKMPALTHILVSLPLAFAVHVAVSLASQPIDQTVVAWMAKLHQE
jgi:SSS family transporter